ncbi:MAG TPA: hypothetical protein VFC31_09155 [Candidatus Limnocylindria bacterium]|nr:hypothetical protein [Candidatus Limnocylindria bacterium]
MEVLMYRALSATATIVVVVATLLLFSGPADAHERRNVGPYQFVVGWLNEPAFAGQLNAATVRISDPRENPAKPVEGLEKSLKIEVIQGGLSPFTGTVRAVFGQPGLYALDMYPTVAGQYRFKVTGTVGTTSVNETFESGPTTFNDVQQPSPLQYPVKVPVGDDLGKRLDAIQSGIDQTRTIAIIGLVFGVLALGGATLVRRRRT